MDSFFQAFDPSEIEGMEIPQKFTFPFYYTPSAIAKLAAEKLQCKISSLRIDHNFGLVENQEGYVIGKMFGVLVVKNNKGELGYLSAFSGKLADSNHHSGFVPPVFDMLGNDSFFKKEEVFLNQINQELNEILHDKTYLKLKEEKNNFDQQVEDFKVKGREELRRTKKERKQRRDEGRLVLDEVAFEKLQNELKEESLKGQFFYKKDLEQLVLKQEEITASFLEYANKIEALKTERKERSNKLQHQLFEQYAFLDANGKLKDLNQIFQSTVFQKPPAGAGECAAPKLLHFAFKNNFSPIALAEFWWGASPKSEIKKHKNYYPACRGKCEPILGHMLTGLQVDENPMLQNPGEGKELKVIYQDEVMAVISKPAEFLSVPGKNIEDSVFTRIKKLYPNSSGPIIVHRLDMSTSGLMLVALNKQAHENLQKQFLKRNISKRYVALLDGKLSDKKGEIHLPLRVDLNDRPKQLVCYDHGKNAFTKWEVKEVLEQRTKVYFYPVTGRTHQLRVHAAHFDGLNTPIVGDDLYGKRENRLCLHAESIEFIHPIKKSKMSFRVEEDF